MTSNTDYENWKTLFPILDLFPRSIVKHVSPNKNTIQFHDNFIHKKFLQTELFEDEDDYYTEPGVLQTDQLREGPYYWLGHETPANISASTQHVYIDIIFHTIWRYPIQTNSDLFSTDIYNYDWHTAP